MSKLKGPLSLAVANDENDIVDFPPSSPGERVSAVHTPEGIREAGWSFLLAVMLGEHATSHVRGGSPRVTEFPVKCRKCLVLVTGLTDLAPKDAARMWADMAEWLSSPAGDLSLPEEGITYFILRREATVTVEMVSPEEGEGEAWAVREAVAGRGVRAIYYDPSLGGDWRRVVYLGEWPPERGLRIPDVAHCPDEEIWNSLSVADRETAAEGILRGGKGQRS